MSARLSDSHEADRTEGDPPLLVLIGGAPGVGKSAVAREALRRLDRCVWLDGDDLWRMNPFVNDEGMRRMVMRNVVAVLQSFMRGSFEYVLFSWVLHLDSVVDAILSAVLPPGGEARCFSLVCDEQTLLDRLASDPGRSTDPALALDRLRATRRQTRMEIVDTEGRGAVDVAEALVKSLSAPPRSR